MRSLILEGRVTSVGVAIYESSPKVVVELPTKDEDEEPKLIEFEVDDDAAKYFASHLFEQVRVTFEILPTPKLVSSNAEEEDPPRKVRSPGDTDRVQDDDDAG